MPGTSEQVQAANREALETARQNLSAVLAAAYGNGSRLTMAKIGFRLANTIKVLLSQPGGGRTYTTTFWTDSQGRLRRGRARPAHTASAPGKPPAVDTGRLRGSITSVVGGGGGGYYVDVGTNVMYAPMLEFGTSKMRPRPFMRPAMAKMAAEIPKEIAQDKGEALRSAAAGAKATMKGFTGL